MLVQLPSKCSDSQVAKSTQKRSRAEKSAKRSPEVETLQLLSPLAVAVEEVPETLSAHRLPWRVEVAFPSRQRWQQ